LLDVYDGRVNAVPKSTRMMRTALQRTSIEMRIGFTVVSPERESELGSAGSSLSRCRRYASNWPVDYWSRGQIVGTRHAYAGGETEIRVGDWRLGGWWALPIKERTFTSSARPPNVALFQISRDAQKLWSNPSAAQPQEGPSSPSFSKSIQLGSVIGSTGSPAFTLDSLASAGAVCVELDCSRVR
jgi:hypothetical protein